MSGFKIRHIRARLVSSAGILALTTGAALAQNASFSLPAEPLSDSLKAVARQTGQNILFTPQALAGMNAPALHGEMSGREAVNILLKGTNLEAAPDGEDGLIVRATQGARHSEIDRPANVRLASLTNNESQAPVQDYFPQTIVAQNNPPPATPAAPAEPGSAAGVEQVVVSASRISIAGYQQPTPVTMVGAAQLDSAANADIGDTIRDLPAVGISSSPLKAGGGTSIFNPVAGLSTVNLRDLGIVRTLVLFDGQRVVQSNVSGGVDLGTIPSTLVKRIDVVTGGASAAWGSDAVAGVVNLILDKTFTGFKADVHGSDTGQDNRRAYGVEASYGFDFDGDRGHIIVAGDYQDSPQTVFIGQAKWWKSTYLLQNPAYTATNGAVQYLHYSNVGQIATQGGVFTGQLGTPNGTGTVFTAGGPKNIQFVGLNGAPTLYNPGVAFGTLAAGGSSNPYNSEIPTDLLSYPYRTTTLFGYGSYRLTPEISASVQLNFGTGWSMNDSTTDLRSGTSNGIKIYRDNAYLNQVAPNLAALIPAGSYAILNTPSINNLDMHNPSFSAFQNSLGVPVNTVSRELMRGVFSLDGALGNDWSWNAYYQHGESRVRSTPTHTVIDPNLNLATDAVVAPAGNALGVPAGTIVCRSSLTNPTNGCQPLNVFGEGVASQAAINYVNTNQNFQTMVLGEDVFSGSMQGVLPWDITGAGAPSVAFGAEYRKEAGRADISALAAAKVLNVGNFGALLGHYSVAEGFIETDVPLIKNGIVDDLSVNAAGRITSYSTSGMVETWKVGATSQVNEDIRLRTTYSYDIRAPDLAELFQQGLVSQASPVDPTLVPPRSVVSFTNQSGNPNLLPEKAFTLSGGVVLTPHWIEGLQLSFDWYSINVKGYISTPTAAQESNFCLAGNQFYCSQFVHNPDGSLKWELLTPQNASSLTTSGLDFQADYSMPFLNGTVAWHLLGNYTDEETISAFGQAPVDYAGQLGSFTGNTAMPKLKGSLSATYTEGVWSATVQGRFIGSGRLQNTWVSGVNVDDNSVPAVGYLDLRGSYNWNENIQLYAAIDNLTDVPPPLVANLGNASNVSLDINTNAGIYDILGRTIRGGVRFKF